MVEPNELGAVLSEIVSILNSHSIAFHITGGLASSFYGEPRLTQDIDIVIRIAPGKSLDQLLATLADRFIVDPPAVIQAVSSKQLFQALHDETAIKIDFHVGEAIEGELSRSIKEEILPGIVVPLVSKEDAILSKLLWIAKGSHKSRQDVAMMLRDKATINWDKLEHSASKLGVVEILNEIKLANAGS